MNPITTIAICASALLCSSAAAQWSTDSTMHQVIADGDGEQVQPKLSPTIDGGSYASWFSSQTGYEVRLQRLDAQGTPAWADNGVLIADRGFSSTQDYGLDIDTSDHALIVFRDDRFGGTRITAQRVAPDGTTPWGANGLQFSNGTDFVASPDVAATSDGGCVIGWINETVTKLVKLDSSGTVQWETELGTDTGESVNLASMHSSDNGSVIVSWVQFGSFFDPKHLYAQKIDSDGNEAWAQRAAVFDGGSLQFGNFPEFVPDTKGGAVFSWYDTANGLNVFAQHLNSDGSERFAHNGVAVSTAPRERVSPAAAYDPAADMLFVSWVELDNNQGSQGVFAQCLSSSGVRQWGNDGAVISAIDNNESGSINVQIMEQDIIVIWEENAGGFGQDQIKAARLDLFASPVWSVDVASDLAQRSRLTTTLSTDGFVICAWQIGDFGVADIESHNINPDGTLGSSNPCPADLSGDGILNFFDVSAFLNAFTAQDPVADFTNDGMFNFFDVSAFLNAFTAGCP